MPACGVNLSGTATCDQERYGNRMCSYHAKLAAGLIALDKMTLSAITRSTEGDLARSPVYAPALKRARSGIAEAVEYGGLRDSRRDLETLLLLDAAGDLEAWRTPDHPPGWNEAQQAAEQRKRRPHDRVRVWRPVQ